MMGQIYREHTPGFVVVAELKACIYGALLAGYSRIRTLHEFSSYTPNGLAAEFAKIAV